MKIIRVIVLVTICSALGFSTGIVTGCNGQIEDEGSDLSAGLDNRALEMSMPLVTTVNGLPEGEDAMLGDPCLLNYPDPAKNFIGYINLEHAADTLNRFGIDKFDDEVRTEIDKVVANVEEAVVAIDDEGQWELLIRPKGDMTTFVNDYLTPTIETMNDPGNEDTVVARVLDESAVIMSFSQEINAAMADRVAQGIDQECAFVRFARHDATPLSEKPMINIVAKAKTSLLDEPLAQALPDMQEEIQKAMAVLNVDKQDGVFRFALGVTDNVDPHIASAITYFSFYLDTDSFILSTIIDKLAEELAAGNIDLGGGDNGDDGDDGDDDCIDGSDEACHASLVDDCFGIDAQDACIASYSMYNERPYNCVWNSCETEEESAGCYVQGNSDAPDDACSL